MRRGKNLSRSPEPIAWGFHCVGCHGCEWSEGAVTWTCDRCQRATGWFAVALWGHEWAAVAFMASALDFVSENCGPDSERSRRAIMRRLAETRTGGAR